MPVKIATILLLYIILLSTVLTLTVYNNAQFDPIDIRYMMKTSLTNNLFDFNACLCECCNNIICSTANYFEINQTCLLYFVQLNQGQLWVVPTIMNAGVYGFQNRTFPPLKVFNARNNTIYAIWNTTAGDNSSSAISGYSTGKYWPSEPPEAAFDNNFTSDYTSYGICNYTWTSVICGQNTGLYFTLSNGSLTLIAFYFVTNDYSKYRDPMTITIEGSNLNGSVLTYGSSWTLIYNGSTGLTQNPGRLARGIVQILPNFPITFISYRILVTSKRGNETCTSYGEFVMIGY